MTVPSSHSRVACILLLSACANPLPPLPVSSSTTSESTDTSTSTGSDTGTTGESDTTADTTATSGSSSGGPNLCGNGMIDEEAGEMCDGDVLPEGTNCQSEGEDFGKGVPGCSEDCSMLDYTVCPQYMLCGNGEVGFGEQCDGMLFGNGVTSCDDLPNYTGDGLVCTDDCMLDESACTMCQEHDQPCDPDNEVCCLEGEICGATQVGSRRCCVQALGCLP
jgi:hypothetical protein